jgi:hypothetical protein
MSVFAGRYFGIADREYCCVFLMADFQLNVELYFTFIPDTLGFEFQGTEEGRSVSAAYCIRSYILIQINLLNRILKE